jgi:hypothetical protein
MKLNRNGTWEYRFYDGAQCFMRTDGGGGLTDWTVWGPTPDEVLARYAPANGGCTRVKPRVLRGQREGLRGERPDPGDLRPFFAVRRARSLYPR